MTTAATNGLGAPTNLRVDVDRLLGVFGIIFGFLATFMVGIFWSMGAVILLTGEAAPSNNSTCRACGARSSGRSPSWPVAPSCWRSVRSL